MKKTALLLFLFVGATSMVVMSMHYFFSNETGILKHKDVADSLLFLVAFKSHIFFGIMAISIGPLQFIHRLRKKYKRLHKSIGYAYVVSVFFSGTTGLVIAHFAMGGMITTIGFTVLSLLWLCSTTMAIVSVLKGNFVQHNIWMHISYALSFAAITQRSLLLIPLLTNVPFMPIYQLSAWLPWILNLLIVSLIVTKMELYQR